MDSFELNKIAGAVLGTLTFTLGLSIVSDMIFSHHPPEKPGYEIVVKEASGGEAQAAAPADVPIANLLGAASVERGAAQSKKCGACHNLQEGAGAKVGTVALASIRATREASVREGRERLPTILGTPEAGEEIGGEVFDGTTEAAVFPGELPERPESIFEGAVAAGSLRFPRFRPPVLGRDAAGRPHQLPHIRLDRALEFLLGDRLA
jgi:hypothetical protein